MATPAGQSVRIGALIEHGTPVSYTILGILLIMSLVSWYIIFTKFWDQYRLGKSVTAVESNFWSAGSAREGADRLPKDDDFRVIAESALRAADPPRRPPGRSHQPARLAGHGAARVRSTA